MECTEAIEKINVAIEGGKLLTTPIWKGVYTLESKFQIVCALGPCLLKVRPLNADENSWTKEKVVDSTEWNAILVQAGCNS